MATDGGSPIQPRKPFALELPRIVRLRIRRIRFEAPELKYFTSAQSERRDAIEFLAETDGEVPVRAYGPALFVGDVEINQSERIDRTTWRFLSFAPERLKPGDPISWGWMKDPESARTRTDYRFAIEDGGPRR
jgi:hypothetical protein